MSTESMSTESLLPVNSGRFQKGQSGNPAGRPPGSRNKATLAAEAMLEETLERLTAQAIDGALGGDAVLLRLCISRLLPAPRGRRVQLDLPAGSDLGDIAASLAATVRAVAEGVISPLEATDLAELIEAQRRLVETIELQRRLTALEEASREVVAQGRRFWLTPEIDEPAESEDDLDAALERPPQIPVDRGLANSGLADPGLADSGAGRDARG